MDCMLYLGTFEYTRMLILCMVPPGAVSRGQDICGSITRRRYYYERYFYEAAA